MKKVIVLDAGHGSDTWSKSGGKGVRYDNDKVFEEHTFNAAVVKYAKELAEDNGLEVILTQPLNQTDVLLTQRTNMIKNKKVDLLISFHADASNDPNVKGHWCFYWTGHKPSEHLAQIWDKHADILLHETLDRNTRESIPGTWTEFHMCREPVKYNIPSILIEHAFMTNQQDLRLLMSHDFRRKCAQAAIESACEFLNINFKIKDWKKNKMKYNPEVIKERVCSKNGVLQIVPPLSNGKGNYSVTATDVRWIKLDKNKIEMKLIWENGAKVSELVKKYNADLGFNFPFFWNGGPVADCKIGTKILNRGYDDRSGAKQTKWHGVKYDQGKLEIGLFDINDSLDPDGFIVKTTPLLLQNGNSVWDYYRVHDGTASDISIGRAQRTLIGLDSNNDIIIAFGDGRTKYDQGLNLEESALFMKDKNCVISLNGDGGGSTVIANQNGVLSQNSGSSERIVNHAVLIYFKEEDPEEQPTPPAVPNSDWRIDLGTKAIQSLVAHGILESANSKEHIDTLLEKTDKWLMFELMKRLTEKVVK